MSSNLKKWTTAAVLVMVLSACSERITNPLTPGSGLFRNDIVIKDDTLYATSDTTFLRRIAPGEVFSPPLVHNFVGKNSGYRAYAPVFFAPLPVRDTVRVLSAKLKLHLVRRQGDSLGNFSFNVHKILRTFDITTLKWTDIDSAFYSPTISGSYSSTVQPDSQQVSVNVDTALVREWLRSGSTPYGFLLIPSPSATVIRGFDAFDVDSAKFRPALEIIVINAAGTVRDTATYATGSDTYVADVDPFPYNPQRVYSQAGIMYQSRLKFDISKLPRGATISYAELQLESDPSLSRLSRFTANPQPAVHALLTDDSTQYEFTSSLGTKSSTSNVYSFDARRQVQYWTTGHNYGLVLRQPSGNEYGTLDLFAFYGSKATNLSQRPRIIVKYAVFQN